MEERIQQTKITAINKSKSVVFIDEQSFRVDLSCYLDEGDTITTNGAHISSQTCINCPFNYSCQAYSEYLPVIPVGEEPASNF